MSTNIHFIATREVMVERIKELAEQAGMTYDKFGMFFAKDKHDEDGVDLEKFAELIVQSILNRLETEREYYANPDTYQPLEYYDKMSAKEDAISDAISMIRTDFGVEK